MIEKIKIPEDMDKAAEKAFKSFTPEENRHRNIVIDSNVITKAAIEVVVDKLNEIIDVINGEGKTIVINATDAESFDDMIRRNPGSIAKVIGDALKNEEPPDEVV